MHDVFSLRLQVISLQKQLEGATKMQPYKETTVSIAVVILLLFIGFWFGARFECGQQALRQQHEQQYRAVVIPGPSEYTPGTDHFRSEPLPPTDVPTPATPESRVKESTPEVKYDGWFYKLKPTYDWK
jgi:hypothetical protein